MTTRDRINEAFDRLNLGDRSLDELLNIRDNWALDGYELESVNEAIFEAEEELES